MASIKKEGKYYKIYFRYGGKQFKRSTRSSSKKIADDLRRKIEDELARGIFKLEEYSPSHQVFLSEFKDEMIQYSQTNKAKSTTKREKSILNNFFDYFGNVAIDSITVKKIEEYKNYLLVSKFFKPRGVNIELRHLSAMFGIAVKYGYISKSPFKDVKKVKTGKKHPKFLTRRQAFKLLTATEGTSSYVYFLIALSTGARSEEVVKIDWRDVDLDNRILKVDGKGAKERTIPLPQILINYLKPLKKETGPVCTGSARPDQVSKNFRKYADSVGLNEFKLHNLRDTYASWLVQKGTNLKVIQELLGHEDIKTTLLYAHLSPDNRFEAVKIIDQVLLKD